MRLKNIADVRFNSLVAKRPVGKNKYGNYLWECVCDCGNIHTIAAGDLKSGRVKSCGCLQIENAKQQAKQNKQTNTFKKHRLLRCLIMNDNKGNRALIDHISYQKIKKYYWYKDGRYWRTSCKKSLHRYITDCPKHLVVDHINHNTDDHRLGKLRVCTTKDNNRNVIRKSKRDSDLPTGITRRGDKFRVYLRRGKIVKQRNAPSLRAAISLRRHWENIYS